MDFKIFFLFNFIVVEVMSKVPTIHLNSGYEMPILGLGTCCKLSIEVSRQMVKDAIDVGYRHIDTAYIYNSEVEVGFAVEEKISKGDIKREDVFITTKLWNTYHSKRKAAEGIRLALNKLDIEYIDLMLINWPMGYYESKGDFPMNNNEIMGSSIDYLETWEALEEAVEAGTVKSIGVSNFNSEQIKRLLDHAIIKPAVNQIESHPYLNQEPLIELCKSYGIAVTAYSPLASGHLVDDATLSKIGSKYNKSAAQVMIRYQIQRGVAAIPKTVDKERMKENLNVFDFTLSDAEIKEIEGMNIGFRYNREESAKKMKEYPFSIPYL